eukprot:1390354-Pyramimonas_sp.AAC.1
MNFPEFIIKVIIFLYASIHAHTSARSNVFPGYDITPAIKQGCPMFVPFSRYVYIRPCVPLARHWPRPEQPYRVFAADIQMYAASVLLAALVVMRAVLFAGQRVGLLCN